MESNNRLTIRLISRDDKWLSRLEKLAVSLKPREGQPLQVQRSRMDASDPEQPARILLLDMDSLGEESLRAVSACRAKHPEAWIAVSYAAASNDRLLRAMRAGANDYLQPSASPDDLQALIRRAATRGEESWNTGRVVSVFGNSGGVGVTTAAIHTAAAAASQLGAGGRVVLVDLVLQRGDVATFLDQKTVYTLVHLTRDLDRADADYLRSALPKHPAGFHVLSAPWSPDEADLVKPAQMGRLLQSLRNAFDLVVIDAGHQFSDLTLAALDRSDRILMLTMPVLPSVRNTKRSLDLFEQLHYDPSKLVPILNRYNAQGGLDRESVEQALGRPMEWCLPNDYESAIQAINQGNPIHSINPRCQLAASFNKLVSARVFGYPEEKSAPRAVSPARYKALVSGWFTKLKPAGANGAA